MPGLPSRLKKLKTPPPTPNRPARNKDNRTHDRQTDTMTTSMTNDGWTTVGARSGAGRAAPSSRPPATSMPAAFGGRPKGRFHTDNSAMYAARHASEAAEKAATERTVEKRRMDALKFDDDAEYPSLGGGSTRSKPMAPPPKSALNFKTVVEATAARDAAAAAEEAIWRAREEREMLLARLAAASAEQRRRALISNRCFDDGPDDYTGDDEEYRGYEGEETLGADDYAPPVEMTVASEYEREGAADADADFNADLYRDRRMGDKGVW